MYQSMRVSSPRSLRGSSRAHGSYRPGQGKRGVLTLHTPPPSAGKSTATVQDAADSFPIGVDHSDLVILYRIGSESQPKTTLPTASEKPPVAFWYHSGMPGRSRNRISCASL
jgi:hypothetical protein